MRRFIGDLLIAPRRFWRIPVRPQHLPDRERRSDGAVNEEAEQYPSPGTRQQRPDPHVGERDRAQDPDEVNDPEPGPPASWPGEGQQQPPLRALSPRRESFDPYSRKRRVARVTHAPRFPKRRAHVLTTLTRKLPQPPAFLSHRRAV